MATLTIPDDTFRRLAARAAELNTTVEQLATPALDRVAAEPAPTGLPAPLPYEEWKRRFDEHMAIVAARAGRYPPGHVTDVSRESIYEGCGE